MCCFSRQAWGRDCHRAHLLGASCWAGLGWVLWSRKPKFCFGVDPWSGVLWASSKPSWTQRKGTFQSCFNLYNLGPTGVQGSNLRPCACWKPAVEQLGELYDGFWVLCTGRLLQCKFLFQYSLYGWNQLSQNNLNSSFHLVSRCKWWILLTGS